MARPNRPARGHKHGQAKLSPAQVKAILAARGQNQRQLAAKFGITQSQVSRIQNGLRWGMM